MQNVKVFDFDGNLIGQTYPKRAKGLIKNGRAEYVSDQEIILSNSSQYLRKSGPENHDIRSFTSEIAGKYKEELIYSHGPSVNKNTEVNIMSKVINFNAREFKFDEACNSNVGSRMFITNADGVNEEIFEIGDWRWSWTQIKCQKTLKPNTDYVFRFAIRGGQNDSNDATLQFIIFSDENWEDRYTYPLAQSLYKPTLSKKSDGNLFRVYEIPFNSGDAQFTNFIFTAQHAISKISTAQELESYADLEDYTYNDWWTMRQDEMNHGESFERDFGNNFGFGSNGSNNHVELDLTGSNISRKALKKLLKMAGKYAKIDLTGSNIYDDDNDEDEEDNDEQEAQQTADWQANKFAKVGVETAYKAVKAQLERAPEDSVELGALTVALESLEAQLAEFDD